MQNESFINYYDLLNIKLTASLDEINKKYRKKALDFHPDKNSNNNVKEQMQQLNAVKNILNNKKLRQDYDKKLFKVVLENGDNEIIFFLTVKEFILK